MAYRSTLKRLKWRVLRQPQMTTWPRSHLLNVYAPLAVELCQRLGFKASAGKICLKNDIKSKKSKRENGAHSITVLSEPSERLSSDSQ